MAQHLTVYHIRKKLADLVDDSYQPILRKPTTVDAFNLTTDMPFEARLFVSKADLEPPPWIEFLKPGFGDLGIQPRKNLSAVLFVRIPYGESKEIFAFTFGQGRFILKSHSYDQNYGLRVALNAIYKQEATPTPERLKSVVTKTIGPNTIRTQRQTDRKAAFESFDVDTQRDMLNGITGIPTEADIWNKQVSGSSSLTASPSVNFEELGDYCKTLMDYYGQEWYKQDFDWINNRIPITNDELIEHLTEILIQSIKDKSDKTYMTFPELSEFSEITETYLVVEGNKIPFDPYTDYIGVTLEINGMITEINTNKINDNWVFVVKYTDGQSNEWTLFNSLSCEIVTDYETGDNRTYILSEGEFFEINQNYLDDLDSFVKGISENKDPIPDSRGNITEGAYNEQAGQDCPTLLYLDKQLVKLRSHTSPIEICDLLSDDGRFIHVKRKLSSSSLSHLFAQGYTSAELLRESPEYRREVLEKIKEQERIKSTLPGAPSYEGKFQLFDEQSVEYGNFEVTYGIITKWNNREFVDALPFFSKVTLRKYVEDLRLIGFKVSYARIDIV